MTTTTKYSTVNRRTVLSLTAGFTAAGACGLVASPSYAQAIEPVASIDMAKLLEPAEAKDMVEGEANAPVTIVEYASLTCPHCADFNNKTLPTIREKYIKTGKVRWIAREFAFDSLATAGFMLARCLPEDRYLPFIQVLFEKNSEWLVQNPVEPLKKIAAMAGLDEQGFNACLQNQEILDKVNSSFERGQSFGVKATPTFFINGDMYEGALSVEQMSAVIDKYLSN